MQCTRGMACLGHGVRPTYTLCIHKSLDILPCNVRSCSGVEDHCRGLHEVGRKIEPR